LAQEPPIKYRGNSKAHGRYDHRAPKQEEWEPPKRYPSPKLTKGQNAKNKENFWGKPKAPKKEKERLSPKSKESSKGSQKGGSSKEGDENWRNSSGRGKNQLLPPEGNPKKKSPKRKGANFPIRACERLP